MGVGFAKRLPAASFHEYSFASHRSPLQWQLYIMFPHMDHKASFSRS